MRVNDDDAGIGDIECGDGVAYEVVSSGAVYHIQLFVEKFGIEDSGEYRITIFFLNGEVVGNGVFGFHGATAFYNSTLVEHSFSECGFT